MFRSKLCPVLVSEYRVDSSARRIVLADSKNYIASEFPADFGSSACFRVPDELTHARLEELERRTHAARTALDRLSHRTTAIPVGISGVVAQLERPLETVIETLDDLSQRAAHEVVQAPEPKIADQLDAPFRRDEDDDAVSVQIVKTDTPLSFKADLHAEFLGSVFSSSAGGQVGFGSWYLSLQTTLLDTNRGHERTLRTVGGTRISSKFMKTTIMACRSAMEIYAGHRHYSAFETAAMCLFQFDVERHQSKRVGTEKEPARSAVNTFDDVVQRIPSYLRALATDLSHEWTSAGYAYDASKLPANFFSPNAGGKYAQGALDTHAIYRLFKNRGVIPMTGRDITRAELAQVDPEFLRFENPVARLSVAFFPGRPAPLILEEDEPLLRAAVDTVSMLLLLQRLLYDSNVYTPAHMNKFQLGAFFGPGFNPAAAAVMPKSAPIPDTSDVSSRDNNLSYLFSHYVLPMYKANPKHEITGFFPGLVPICLAGRARGQAAVSLGHYHHSLVNLVDLELRAVSKMRQNAMAVLAVHDALTVDCETGLAKLLSVFNVKQHTRNAMRALNVETDTDTIYLICLGCVPIHITVA